ncbi:MAG TPA: hypothetical protein PLX20_15500 [Rhodocyclaceae bacterium]|nr:hypothetical protein [Rhodocyclaceae bacterium]HMV54285.1 hypothetical protein [Rhodocyclaceae bacterium]HNA04954.1 hypothetical protein [Rhodocyclaceae bacterium]HNB78560.1 hypothetical protein [Rhodocyclaceae bacterium]HNC62891.1 hypothetical protein [Rhodocyclaceae bacterium]
MATEGMLLGKLLQLREPWAVREHRLDQARQRLDIWIGVEVQRGWFGRPKARAEEGAEQVWRHLDSAGWKTFVHVIPPKGADLSSHPWAGSADLPFTRAMAKRIFDLLNEGLDLNGICTLYGIKLDELWRFKYALDSGKTGMQAEKQAASGKPVVEASPVTATASAAASPAGEAEVPDVSDPVWLQLASGTIEPDIRVLSLKLLLTRIRSQMEIIQDDEVRMLKLRELHRYFVKNARMLSHELAQIRGV